MFIGTQSGLALSLAAETLTAPSVADLRAKAVQHLVDDITNKRNGTFSTGIIGLKSILDILNTGGYLYLYK